MVQWFGSGKQTGLYSCQLWHVLQDLSWSRSCLCLQSYTSSSLFSWHFIFLPCWMLSVFPNLPPSSQLLLEDCSLFSICLVISKSFFIYSVCAPICGEPSDTETHYTGSFYIKDLSISGFWYLLGVLESTPWGTEGQLPLPRYCCLPEACPGWVNAQLCVPTRASLPLWWLPIFLLLCCTRTSSSFRVRAVFPSLSAHCLGLWPALPLPNCESEQVAYYFTSGFSSSFVKWV